VVSLSRSLAGRSQQAPMQTYKIREYDENDMPRILEMATQFCDSKNIKLEAGSFADYTRRVYKDGMVFVAEADGKAVGAMGILLTTNPFTGARTMMQTDLFVDKDYRNQGIGPALQQRAKEFSNQLGIEELTWVSKQH
jgi:predicted N-acetyltransferase YhbS